MREEAYREVQKLWKLLTSRLSEADRKTIVARIKELQDGGKQGASPPSPFVLGTFDRPPAQPASQAHPEPEQPVLTQPSESNNPPGQAAVRACARGRSSAAGRWRSKGEPTGGSPHAGRDRGAYQALS